MRVWIVERSIPYEGSDVLSVWAIEGDANREALRLSDDVDVTMNGYAVIHCYSQEVRFSHGSDVKGGPAPCS